MKHPLLHVGLAGVFAPEVLPGANFSSVGAKLESPQGVSVELQEYH